jgi:uncharacterized protein
MNALFIGDWDSLAMVHLQIAPQHLQPAVPFELDLFEGSAFVSLVFFTMRGMRLARGARLLNWLFYPFREQRFLNVRTYVRHQGEPGIHFIAEWISNPLCVHLGPVLYSLPYRRGRHRFSHHRRSVTDLLTNTSLTCNIRFSGPFATCERGSRDEFLFERYAAVNSYGEAPKCFHVSHAPWEQCRADSVIMDDSLLGQHFHWFPHAHLAGANYSPGVCGVQMGWPIKIASPCAHLHPADQWA